MNAYEVQDIAQTIFRRSGADILSSPPGTLHIQLTEELDQALMNRPFYWQYVRSTGETPKPMQLHLKINPDAPGDGEVLHSGSPRFHQLLDQLRLRGRWTRLYEETRGIPGNQTGLHPWLNVNVKISYLCDRRKDIILSLGIHLLTGTVKDHFMDSLASRPLSPHLPELTFIMAPIIKPPSAFVRIKQMLMEAIDQGPDDWAKAAEARMQEDLELLDAFYAGEHELPESYEIEKKAIEEQYTPHIYVEVINAGIFYLLP
ncbi:hypothetical protein G4V62_00875 [Bacillaceae bacterium SIJ1]|uniref:YqhG family protein n=1 Tax=Litoribacterium kuwaitense TaxID=1398745 RepID=UPI0013EABEAC|nr:YqhG family protein [Litoribacterium kuwaitense]NGP43582.1 hypothetical protein [Litoribacterium kuwaitense]